MQTIDRLELTFDMFTASSHGIKLAASAVQRFFGKENYDFFRAAGKKEQYISSETRQRVDQKVYGQVGQMLDFGGVLEDWEVIWKSAMEKAIITHNYARGIVFADQDRQATLTTNTDWDDGRPSTALERLTMPTRLIGAQCKYEQGRQLGLAQLCAEVMSRDENGNARAILTALNNSLENNFFVGKKGDPQIYHTFSYHMPGTNRLVAVSRDYPHNNFGEGLSVKSLDFPVRILRVQDEKGKQLSVPALYDPRDKDIESAVIKAKERSLLATRQHSNQRIIETSPYATDQLGVQFVVMEGGRPMRDLVVSNLEQLFSGFEGTRDIVEDDQVDTNHGSQNRVEFRRRLIYLRELKNPIELIIYSLEDWIPAEYEVGEFSEELGMHNGRAHDLYKLKMISNIAEFMWPFKVFKIPLEPAVKASSYDYAARLRRKQRIHPSPYLEED